MASGFCSFAGVRMVFLFVAITIICVAVAAGAACLKMWCWERIQICNDWYFRSNQKRTVKITREAKEKCLLPEQRKNFRQNGNDTCKIQKVVTIVSTFRILVVCFVNRCRRRHCWKMVKKIKMWFNLKK